MTAGRAISVLVVFLCVLAAGEAGAQMTGQPPSPRGAIEAANKKFTVAAAKADAAGIASLYTTDAAAYPANSDIVRGRDAIQAMWKTVIDSGVTQVELNTGEVESSGEIAYETGTYVMKTKDGTLADRGKYVVIWKRSGGGWLIHRDIWTTSLPAEKK